VAYWVLISVAYVTDNRNLELRKKDNSKITMATKNDFKFVWKK